MLIYCEFFNTDVSNYISFITISSFARCTTEFEKFYEKLSSSSSTALSFKRHFSISGAVRFGRNSVVDEFKSLLDTPVELVSQPLPNT